MMENVFKREYEYLVEIIDDYCLCEEQKSVVTDNRSKSTKACTKANQKEDRHRCYWLGSKERKKKRYLRDRTKE